MHISFDEACHIVSKALECQPKLAAKILLTAMNVGEISYESEPIHTGNRTMVVVADEPPSTDSVLDHDEVLALIESRRNPKREGAVPPAPTSWPWGNYETKLLRELAAAADKFWKNYDPADSTTAPTNEQVVSWLMGRGVAKRNAQIIATMLRADGLRPGPRK